MSYPWSGPEDLWIEGKEFSERAFGPPSYRGPIGPLRHLEKEAREAQEKPDDISEYADCLLLVFDAARRQGFSIYELIEAAREKVRVNEKREWPDWREHPGDVALEHDREGESR